MQALKAVRQLTTPVEHTSYFIVVLSATFILIEYH